MYQLGRVAEAIDESPAILNTWCARKYFLMREGDRDAGDAGRVRLFSFETIMQIAVGDAIHRLLPIPVKAAMKAAVVFAHTGDDNRNPGRPFSTGQTFLVVTAKDQVVVQTDHATPPVPLHMRDAYIAVDVGPIYKRVCDALGGDPLMSLETQDAIRKGERPRMAEAIEMTNASRKSLAESRARDG